MMKIWKKRKMTERDTVEAWLAAERAYQEQRPAAIIEQAENDALMRTQGCGPDSFWWNEVHHYLYRANRLGLNTPLGKQAAAKAAFAAQQLLGSVIRVFGPLPAPGVISGDIRDWREGTPDDKN